MRKANEHRSEKVLAKQFAIWHRFSTLFPQRRMAFPFPDFCLPAAICNLFVRPFGRIALTSLGPRPNESGLLMCSRISSLDYTCNLRRADALSILVLFAFAGLLSFPFILFADVFLFGLHFMIPAIVSILGLLGILSGNVQTRPVLSYPVYPEM